jgi:dTMP kinase
VAGKFIVFEGIEGSGKTTQARLLADWLAAHGVAHLLTREPGGTAIGETVRQLLLHGDAMDARAELMLYLAARAALVTERIMPALAKGEVVVADRYEMSTFAYQGYGRGLPLEEVRAANAAATGGLAPDLTIVVRVPGGVGGTRLAGRGQADRIEREGEAFHQRVAQAYDRLTATEPRVEAVDGTPSPPQVHADVVRLLQQRFPETFVLNRV